MEKLLPLHQPLLESPHAGEFSEIAGFEFEAEDFLEVQQLAFGVHDLGHVALGDGAVVDDRGGDEAARVTGRQPADIAQQLFQGRVVAVHRLALVAIGEDHGFLADDVAQVGIARQGQFEARGKLVQLGW